MIDNLTGDRDRLKIIPACLALFMLLVASTSACAANSDTIEVTDSRSPLRLDRVIELPDVKGRIDHLALDPEHHRLFVAEYGNGSVDEIDLVTGKVVGRVAGLREPQGVAYLPGAREVVVASGDGTVRFYAAADRREVARLDLGDDADNVRIDERNGHVIIGYGNGSLATIDPATHRVLARLILPGHPEGFRLVGSKAFVNIPDRGIIVAADLDRGQIASRWQTGLHRLNFPMIAGPTGDWIAVAYRLPAAVQFVATNTGKVLETRSACGDADDLFVDGTRVLVICGAGYVEIGAPPGGRAESIRITTGPGARTGLFSPELHRLFVAVPARGRVAAIWSLADQAK